MTTFLVELAAFCLLLALLGLIANRIEGASDRRAARRRNPARRAR